MKSVAAIAAWCMGINPKPGAGEGRLPLATHGRRIRD